MNGRSLLESLQERLASEETQLPVFDPVVARLREIVAREDFSLDELELAFNEDPGLVADVLRHANSSFFRGLDKVATVRDAVLRLGAAEVANLATAAAVRRQFRSDDPMLRELLERLWRHSIVCATGARWIAQRAHDPGLAARAFVAGLLHDSGKLLLLRALDDLRTSKQLDEGDAHVALSHDLILSVVDSMHASEGANLLTRWNLPAEYVEVARDHHADAHDPRKTLLCIVRLADAACRKLGIALTSDPTLALLAMPEVTALGLSELALAELEIALEDAVGSLSA